MRVCYCWWSSLLSIIWSLGYLFNVCDQIDIEISSVREIDLEKLFLLFFRWYDECKKFWSKQNKDSEKLIQKYAYYYIGYVALNKVKQWK